MNIRKMEMSDVEKIIEIEFEAFSFAFKNKRKLWHIKAKFESEKNGCFVYEQNGEVVGFIFTRTLGKIGWIGTFGVKPEYQNRGIGSRLLKKGLEYLEKKKCRVIGLETRADLLNNIGFYLSFGFEMAYPTLVFKKDFIDRDAKRENFGRLCTDTSIITELSSKIYNGYDLGKEAELFIENKTGNICVFNNGQEDIGYAILREVEVFENAVSDFLYVYAMGITDKSEDKMRKAIETIEEYAVKKEFRKVVIPVNTSNKEAVALLVKMGYMVNFNRVRMLYKGKYDKIKGAEFSSWIM